MATRRMFLKAAGALGLAAPVLPKLLAGAEPAVEKIAPATELVPAIVESALPDIPVLEREVDLTVPRLSNLTTAVAHGGPVDAITFEAITEKMVSVPAWSASTLLQTGQSGYRAVLAGGDWAVRSSGRVQATLSGLRPNNLLDRGPSNFNSVETMMLSNRGDERAVVQLLNRAGAVVYETVVEAGQHAYKDNLGFVN